MAQQVLNLKLNQKQRVKSLIQKNFHERGDLNEDRKKNETVKKEENNQ